MEKIAGRSSLQVFESQLGWMAVRWKDDLILGLTFSHADPQAAVKAIRGTPDLIPRETVAMRDARQRIRQFASGKNLSLQSIGVSWDAYTPFQKKVLSQCRTIGWGEVLSYRELACLAGNPRAARAVGGAMRSNRHPLVIPCHRVVGAGLRLGGYSAADGTSVKRDLLRREGNNLRS